MKNGLPRVPKGRRETAAYYITSSRTSTVTQHSTATSTILTPFHAAAMPTPSAAAPASGFWVASSIAGKVITDSVTYGDLCCVSWQNKMLVKRVIGLPGDTIVMDRDGRVSVNGTPLDEPYVPEYSLGQCDVEFPYEVPDHCIFILGDNRLLSVDSRNSDIGSIGTDQIIGKVLFRIWPFR